MVWPSARPRLVVLNRVAVANRHGGYWWGKDIADVCLKPFQFSCWNANDPQRAKLLSVAENNIHFATALRIARRAAYGLLLDSVAGATHYHTLDILPRWAQGQTPVAIIGHHMFYRLEA